jgi:hypothetical protein
MYGLLDLQYSPPVECKNAANTALANMYGVAAERDAVIAPERGVKTNCTLPVWPIALPTDMRYTGAIAENHHSGRIERLGGSWRNCRCS